MELKESQSHRQVRSAMDWANWSCTAYIQCEKHTPPTWTDRLCVTGENPSNSSKMSAVQVNFLVSVSRQDRSVGNHAYTFTDHDNSARTFRNFKKNFSKQLTLNQLIIKHAVVSRSLFYYGARVWLPFAAHSTCQRGLQFFLGRHLRVYSGISGFLPLLRKIKNKYPGTLWQVIQHGISQWLTRLRTSCRWAQLLRWKKAWASITNPLHLHYSCLWRPDHL